MNISMEKLKRCLLFFRYVKITIDLDLDVFNKVKTIADVYYDGYIDLAVEKILNKYLHIDDK